MSSPFTGRAFAVPPPPSDITDINKNKRRENKREGSEKYRNKRWKRKRKIDERSMRRKVGKKGRRKKTDNPHNRPFESK